MPATLTTSHTLALVSPVVAKPLTAPLSRTDDAVVVSSPCMTCGVAVDGWGWVNFGGRGVLMHDVDEESVPCPIARPIDWATGHELPSIDTAGLSDIEWITALYCSDFVLKSRPPAVRLAALIAEGLARVGYAEIAEKASQLREFWDHCEAGTDTSAVWGTYADRFDRTRIMQSSFEIERSFRALVKHFTPAVGVAA
ncbi:hypothetical protein AB0D12_40670 [Streptomyces sp. NPDC048479]|uniref:hypothetical protein n=1 Tax=Streptomyces sp. NPDC048479 TaxID=3154725 RepID=UPI0034139CC0